MRNYIDTNELKFLVKGYVEHPTIQAEKNLEEVFSIMAEDLFNFMLLRQLKSKKNKIVEEMIDAAFDKIDSYDPEKGKAFNYFTTIMLCMLRQIFHLEKRKLANETNI